MSNSKRVGYNRHNSEGKVFLFDEENIKVEKKQTHCYFKVSKKSMVLLFLGIVTFLILSVMSYFVTSHITSKNCLFKEFVVSDRTNKNKICSPLQSVKRIEIVLSQDSNNICSDAFSCINLLINETETVKYYRQNNLRYNFLISSDFRLLLVFGYDCNINSSVHSEVNLTSSYINNSRLSSVSSGSISNDNYLKIIEIIFKAIKCNVDQSKFTMSSFCVDGCNLSRCGNIFEEEITRLKMLLPVETYPLQSLKSENRTLKDILKWSVCEDPFDMVPHIRKVVKWTSLANESCVTYEPVDHISVEVVEVQNPLHCSESSSCTEVSSFIENVHDGLQYNFIFGTHGTLYVGGGFRCKTTKLQRNSLKIKVLRTLPNSVTGDFHEMHRIGEIIEHGLNCGKILNNYSISENCSIHNCYPWYENIDGNILSILSTSFGKDKENDEMDSESKVIPHNIKWKSSCHHRKNMSTTLKIEPFNGKNKTLFLENSIYTTTVHSLFSKLNKTTSGNEADEIITSYEYGEEVDYGDYDDYTT